MNDANQLNIALQNHTGYAAAWAKLQELRGEYAATDSGINSILTAMVVDRPRDDVRQQRIARLVGDRSEPVV